MKKIAIFSLLALLVVGIIASTGLASAYQGDYSVTGPNYTEERHQLMEEAFDTLDYSAWYILMTENGRYPRVVELITPSNFEIFVQAHEAGKNGDYETAAILREELGLNNGSGPKDGTGFGKGKGLRMQQNEFIDADKDGTCDNIGSQKGRK